MSGDAEFQILEQLLTRPGGAPPDEIRSAVEAMRRTWDARRAEAEALSAAQAAAVANSAVMLAELEEARVRADELAKSQADAIVNSALMVVELEEARARADELSKAQADAVVNSALLMAELEEAHEQTRRASAALREAYDELDREMTVVAEIQRSLLPTKLPEIPTLEVAAHYQTSAQAGGDYYDFLPLPDGRWGVLVADVSGHGTPAAVLMAVTHCIAHMHPGPAAPPGLMLAHVNRHLAMRYTGGNGRFVTAFYGVYSPATREFHYAAAGHNPPRLRRAADRTVVPLDGAAGAPLGILDEEQYSECRLTLQPGDQLLLYTDGITEARGAGGERFELDRLDAVLAGSDGGAAGLLAAILDAVRRFTADAPADDDRTLVAMAVI